LASGHKSGGLVLVLASGLSAHPKNARDLTAEVVPKGCVLKAWSLSSGTFRRW
jgi:hypothetical protein